MGADEAPDMATDRSWYLLVRKKQSNVLINANQNARRYHTRTRVHESRSDIDLKSLITLLIELQHAKEKRTGM